MRYICKFNPKTDIKKVMPDMSVDLKSAIETGVVLDTGTVAEHNDIDDPSTIYGRVRDCFDAFDAKQRILALNRAAKEAATSVAAKQETLAPSSE
ncbi:MAG: hypothetical protein K6E35_08765 [Bacteroidales bacterium]|nr:hypothetical protein [Bacteroidales bacterium]